MLVGKTPGAVCNREKCRHTVDGSEILHQLRLVTGFYTSQVVQDFFHQQYHPKFQGRLARWLCILDGFETEKSLWHVVIFVIHETATAYITQQNVLLHLDTGFNFHIITSI